MKKYFYFFLILALGAISFSCSNDKDNEPQTENGIKGIWVDPDDPMGADGSSILVTDNCWIWDNYYGLGTLGLVKYINASYDTLIKNFEPDYDFCIYRYDKNNDVYLLYSWIDDKNGIQLFEPWPIILKVSITDNMLSYQQYHYSNLEPDNEDEFVPYDELMSNNKYASLLEGGKIEKIPYDDLEIRIRYK